MKNNNPQDVEAYISSFPNEIQDILQKFRKTVKSAAPDATEKMSYGIPTLFQEGNLIHYGAYKNHIGFYPGPAGISAFEEQLSEYELSKGTIKFPYTKPLPLDIITKITQYRITVNTENAALKKKK